MDAALDARDAYRLWAPLYDRENAVTALENRVVAAVSPPTGRVLLDAGCGVGRRIPTGAGAPRLTVGLDLVPAMLRAQAADAATADRAARRALPVCGDVRSLPLRGGLFDVIWLRLVTGHLPRLEEAYAELARVGRPGARLVVSDFHPAAVAAGHARTFRDRRGRKHVVEHHVHTAADHEAAAAAAAWTADEVVEAPAGEPERQYYERAGRAAQLERERDLPLILLVCFRR